MRAAAIVAALVAMCGVQSTTEPRTRVVMLGTGTPNADPDRFGPAVAVVVDDASYLVDFGVGVVRRAAAAERAGVSALGATRLKRAFATHLHSDHTLGLADLILSPWVLDRDAPLQLYGPRGLRAMVTHLVAAYADDIRIRRTGGEPAHKYDPTVVDVHEIVPGVVYKDERVTVTAFAVSHGAWPQAFGYRFQTADRSVVISGDAGPNSHIEDQCRKCDVLIHEAYSEHYTPADMPNWLEYRAKYHTTTAQLAEIANKTQPGLLIMYHRGVGSRGNEISDEQYLAEVRRRYEGRVVVGHDLDVY